jgi:hypothetical protein
LVAGGGATGSTLINCVLVDNSAVFRTPASHNVVGYLSAGGGAWGSTLVNCTLTGNWAGSYGGGAGNSTINNSIILDGAASSTLNHCWTNAPLFVDETNGNLRLQSNSPCINAGNNAYAPAGPDLDGNLRIRGGTVDIGAYEFQAPVSQISYAWLQHYGLPVNAFTDSSDPDGDGVDNYQEWLARSDPTNPFSFPPLLTLIPYGANIFLIWPTNAVGFTLQSTTNLNPPIIWNTNSPGPVVIGNQNVVINPASNPRQFYRLVHLVKRASNENTHQ